MKILLYCLVLLCGVVPYCQAKEQPSSAHFPACQAAHVTKLINPVKALELNWQCLSKTIKDNHASLQDDPQKLYKTVQKVVLPMIAINHMAGATLGPKWREASAKQRQVFIDDFGYMLVKSYSAALLRVTDYIVKFNPLRDDSWKRESIVLVQGRVIAKSNQKGSSITYYMERSGNTWKIYDVSIEGVSFIKNFSAQFREFATMDALLTRLKAVNQQKASN